MKNLISKIRSEDGDSNIIEAIIVYPVVLIVVVFLIVLGFTYVQEGFLNYKAQSISDYLAKSVLYPGYTIIQRPEYLEDDGTVRIGDINEAMGMQAPYRYLFGLFGGETGVKDINGDDVADKYAEKMVSGYLRSHGYLKSSGGNIDIPERYSASLSKRHAAEGYACAVSATTSQIKVYLAQNYIFARFFSMIGLGNKVRVISGEGNTAVCDSLEIMKTVDMGADVLNFLAEKLGIDTSKLKTLKELVQGGSTDSGSSDTESK